MKKFTFIACAAMTLAASAQTFTAGSFNFNVLSEEDATVELVAGDYNGKVVTAPSETVTYNGKTYTVVAIGDGAFKDMTFTCGSGTIWLPATIQYVGAEAFSGTFVNTSNTTIGSADCVGFRGNPMTFDPTAFNNNKLNAVNVLNDTRYANLSATANLGNAYRGVLFSSDYTVLYMFPGDKRDGTNTGSPAFTSYNVYSKVTKIAQNAFYGNKRLKTVNFPSGLVEIEAGAFHNTVLTSVHFPASLQTVGEDAFTGNDKITVVTCDAEVPPTGVMFDDAVYANATLNIPEGSEAAYKAAPGWKKFFGEEEGIEGDVNVDGLVDVVDVNTVVTMLLDGVYEAKADLNKDNLVDVVDINAIISIILK